MFYEIPLLFLRTYFFSHIDRKVVFETDTEDSKITLNVYSIDLFL